jgi:hypothetical protein
VARSDVLDWCRGPADKPARPGYFGFAKTLLAGQLVRTGESTQFFVREDETDEKAERAVLA